MAEAGQKQRGGGSSELRQFRRGSGQDMATNRESNRCSGFWLGQLGGVWGGVSMEKEKHRRRKPHPRAGVADRISSVNVDLEIPFKSLKS